MKNEGEKMKKKRSNDNSERKTTKVNEIFSWLPETEKKSIWKWKLMDHNVNSMDLHFHGSFWQEKNSFSVDPKCPVFLMFTTGNINWEEQIL